MSSTGHAYAFDILAIIPWIRRHRVHPISGEPLETKDLVKLKLHKNTEGLFACPATEKVFSDSTKICALRTTGNVYAYDTLEKMCFSRKNLRDLVDDTPFTRADVLILNDASNETWMAAHRMSTIKIARESQEKSLSVGAGGAFSGPEVVNSGGGTIRMNEVTRSVLAELPKEFSQSQHKQLPQGPHITSVHQKTSIYCAASATSTMMPLTTSNSAAPVLQQDLEKERWARVASLGKKGLLTITTSKGSLNIELDCDLVPRTCENFLLLAQRGYYDGTSFHRSIRGFMIQGGDPSGSGRGGESACGGKFPDEFHPKLKHDSRGVLSMANSGPNTNGSQFFITYAPCPHLDSKHSVFGRVVGGEATLAVLEAHPTDPITDKPKGETPLMILRVNVLVDPTRDVSVVAATAPLPQVCGDKIPVPAPAGGTSRRVGKYLPVHDAPPEKPATMTAEQVDGESLERQPPPAKRTKPGGFDFSAW